MKEINDFLVSALQQRENSNSLRTLKSENSLADFCSNDYLSFSRSDELRSIFEKELEKYTAYRLGAAGSRLLAGNDEFTESLEKQVAAFHQAEAALIYNSGYDANLGLFSSLPQRGDTVICDELVHASIIDGVRLSHATRFIFKHNDLESLADKLKHAGGNVFIVVESVYSMDGDEAPLQQLCELAKVYHAALIVDEAHATGIFGEQGRGLVSELGLCTDIFARVVTFGKALGSHGAAVIGSSELRAYLINYSRSFIYTTAAPFMNHLLIRLAYHHLEHANHQALIHERIQYFKMKVHPDKGLLPSRSAIQAILVPGNSHAKAIAGLLQESGFDIRPILSPTVPQGWERLRICLHNHNSLLEIDNLCNKLNQIL